ncbi:type II toxin-antitoxin system VapC family toxin [Acidimicrobiia bacterium EGI L10123]|uniref:type II toxin-antitoxin system VapC family toxin n=1 Tax=Salinilacustrithrix flava TaxID=2957203 RepID=UPI003D7C35A5|nr:type II toxin-antitoxin system VapC family toxin [Acidimicrobiia bacterium EGI L10123]
MIVLDASAAIEVLIGEPNETLAARLAGEAVLHAPHLLDTEVLHVLRRLEQQGSLTGDRVDGARRLFELLEIDRYPHVPLSARVWELRPVLSAHDATYVALAEALDATLVTTDRRIAGASGLHAQVEVH